MNARHIRRARQKRKRVLYRLASARRRDICDLTAELVNFGVLFESSSASRRSKRILRNFEVFGVTA